MRLHYRFRLFALSFVVTFLLLFTNTRNLFIPNQSANPGLPFTSSEQSNTVYRQFAPAILNPQRSFAQTPVQPADQSQSSVIPSPSPTPFSASNSSSAPAAPPTTVARSEQQTNQQLTISQDFQDFIDSVVDGQAGVVRGLYVDGVLSLRIVQQPDKQPLFVSEEDGVATQFQNAALKGVTGLLAHNFLSGALFFNVQTGQEMDTVDGDGKITRYRVEKILTYQKLKPSSPTSDFIDLETNQRQSSGEVFSRVYSGQSHLTLQTCLRKGDNWSWGLLFVMATPIN